MLMGKRSFMADFVSAYFRLKNKPTEAQAESGLDTLKQAGEKAPQSPKNLPTRYENHIFYANEDSKSDITVFYIHGGGYEHDFSPFHWKFIKKIIENTDALVIAPAYHLIPFGNCQDSFNLIVPLYREYTQKHLQRKIVLMGDSAGAGLALALAEHFSSEHIRVPDELILMSPWVDVSMENPEISEYVSKDPWLTIPWLKVCGRHWAGQYDVRDWHVSPLNGNCSGLQNVTVFVGTSELFYPDVTKFFGMLDQKNNHLIIGHDMNHVYPILPIPEAKDADKKIFDIIKR